MATPTVVAHRWLRTPMAIEARGVTRRNRFESGCVRYERINPTAGRRKRIPGAARMTDHAVVIGLRLVILEHGLAGDS